MKPSKLIIPILFMFVNLFAQEKLLTIEDVVLNSFSKLAPERVRFLNWIPNSRNYTELTEIEKNPKLISHSINQNETEDIITLSEINSELKANGYNDLRNFPAIRWISKNGFIFFHGNSFISFDKNTKKLTKQIKLDPEANNNDLSPSYDAAAFTKNYNLYLSHIDKGIIQITDDGEYGIINGESVHRNEFGITKGTFWSPNGNYLAFYRMDETMVDDYPLVDLTTVPASLKNIKYPMAGKSSHQVQVFVYNLINGKKTKLDTGELLDQYLTNITWSPDDNSIYVAHLNRDQNHLRLIKYDAESGKQINILFEEKDNEYVEPEEGPIFYKKDEYFLWFSERNNFRHLYLYDDKGNLKKQVTDGNFDVISYLGFNQQENKIFIMSTESSPLERHLYSVDLETLERIKLTEEAGVHSILFNSEYEYYIDQFNSSNVPFTAQIKNVFDDNLKQIKKSSNPLTEYNLGKIEYFEITNDENIKLYYRMFLPPDFDKIKKYPLIIYVYGGPHAQEINNSWPMGRYDFWFYYMTQKGYIVLSTDNRGSANRGLEFEQATFRRLGTKEMEDQIFVLKNVISQGYVDSTRIGVYGWSYGGFMATSLITRHPNLFKVAVGGGAVIDWKMYEVMYTERYMDTPETNPEGYDKANLLNYVKDLEGKLLLVHGTSDPTVVWQNTLSFVKEAVKLNKQIDYFPYPGHGHGVGSRDAIHLYNKITNYFLDNL